MTWLLFPVIRRDKRQLGVSESKLKLIKEKVYVCNGIFEVWNLCKKEKCAKKSELKTTYY